MEPRDTFSERDVHRDQEGKCLFRAHACSGGTFCSKAELGLCCPKQSTTLRKHLAITGAEFQVDSLKLPRFDKKDGLFHPFSGCSDVKLPYYKQTHEQRAVVDGKAWIRKPSALL